MVKPLLLILVLMSAAAYGGYVYGTKAPTVGDCVNSIFGSK